MFLLKTNNNALNNAVVTIEGFNNEAYNCFKKSLGSRLVVKTADGKRYQLSTMAGYMMDMNSYNNVCHVVRTKSGSVYEFVEM